MVASSEASCMPVAYNAVIYKLQSPRLFAGYSGRWHLSRWLLSLRQSSISTTSIVTGR